MPDGIRSFIAIDVEDQAIIERIIGIQSLIGKGNVKLVEPENIHLTLWFLGNIGEGMVDIIYEQVLKKLDFKPFTIELRGLGAFPKVSRPRVIWIGVRRGEKELKNIYEQLKRLLPKLGFRPDPKGFSPHITIARVKGRRTDLTKIIMENTDYEFGSFEAERIKLKKSTLTPKGPVYTTLKEVYAKKT